MLESIHFSYDGVYSVDMGLLNCKIGGGMFEETFLPTRQIKEKKVGGRDKPYFQGVESAPVSFALTFAFEYYYDEKRIREVARWLLQDYYKPFYVVSNPNRIYYCMAEGDSKLIHNGLQQGYLTLNFRCESAYSYTAKTLKEKMKFDSTKLTKSVAENTFSYEMGTMSNIEIVGGKMSVKKTDATWVSFAGKKWSDL